MRLSYPFIRFSFVAESLSFAIQGILCADRGHCRMEYETMAVQEAEVATRDKPTEHPHIVRKQTISGERPFIRGTGMPVWLIASFYKAGDSVESILISYPHLSPAAVYDAISYYHDHQAELEEEIAAQRIENILKKTGATIDERRFLRYPDRVKTSDAG